MQKKVSAIFLNALPVILMIGLIPIIGNDYTLAFAYLIIITAALWMKKEKGDIIFLIFGFFSMIVSEYFFISTGVEIFLRRSLFGVMPVWLPFLWAYGFVAIKRSVYILTP